jgi:hypothetical protein
MVAAETMEGINGNTSYRLPHDATIEVLKKYNRFQPKVIIDTTLLEKYFGKYELGPELYLTIFKEGENIFAQITNRIKVELTAVNKNTFDVFDYGIRIVFNIEDNNNISDLTILSNGERKVKKIE